MTATYVYCIVKAAAKPSLAKVPSGLPGAGRPRVLPAAPSIWIIVAEVPLEAYGPEPLERQLGDLDWVGRVALAHERVVEHFARRAALTVIPMKLFTMFSSPDRAVADITKRKTMIAAAIRRIAGAEEWGVRVMRSAPSAVASAPAERVTSGAAFLAAKKRTRDDAQRAKVAAADVAAEAFGRLAAVARDVRRRGEAPPAGATSPLLDAAFLVPAARRERFKTAASREAARCAAAGAQLTLSGPWPAYNFVQGDEQR